MTPRTRTQRRPILLCAAAFATVLLAGDIWRRSQAVPAGPPGNAASYACPMHPALRFPRTGDCPACGMRLVASETSAVRGGDPEFAPVFVPAPDAAALGIRTARVQRRPLERWIRTAGRIVRGRLRAPLLRDERAAVSIGLNVRISSLSRQGAMVRGRVVSTGASEVEVRPLTAELPPGEPLLAEVILPLGERICVPEESVLWTDRGPAVFVKAGGDHFYPRRVVCGALGERYQEILSGALESEEVAVGGLSYLDAASRLGRLQ